MLKKIAVCALMMAACAIAQDSPFRVVMQRWTNHDFPEIIKAGLPLTPIDAQRDGVLALVTLDSESIDKVLAVEVTINYRDAEGKRQRRVKTAALASTGCTPEPCRWVAVVFDDIGKVDLGTVQVSVAAWREDDEAL